MGQSFELEYSTSFDDRLWDAIQTEDGNYFLVGHIAKPESNKYFGLIIKVNHEGKLTKEKRIDLPGRSYDIYSIMQDASGSLILAGKSSDTSEEMLHSNLELRRISYDLEPLDSITYYLDSTRNIGGLTYHLDSAGLIIAGGLYSDTTPQLKSFIYRFNHSFDTIHSALIDLIKIYQIHPLGDTAYWCAKGLTASYIILDSLFQLTQWEDVPNIKSQYYGLKWDTDSSFYMVGMTKYHDVGVIRQFHPMESTGYLHNTWGNEDVWDFPAPSGALDYTNKDSIYVGATSPFWPWGWFPSDYVVLQMDSLLNIRWERFYGDGKYYYELMKVIATADGGCLLAGTRYDYESGIKERDIYVVKLDKNGLIVGQEEPQAIAVSEALVYPNPGTSEIHVRVAAQHPESVFQLFDMNGKTVLEQPITGKRATIPAQFLDAGTYFYRISGPNGLLQSGKWIKM